jgi:hypothetical protein
MSSRLALGREEFPAIAAQFPAAVLRENEGNHLNYNKNCENGSRRSEAILKIPCEIRCSREFGGLSPPSGDAKMRTLLLKRLLSIKNQK